MEIDPLGIVMMKCPATGQPVPTGVAMTRSAFDAPNCVGGEAACPSCGGGHRWSRAEAWIQVDGGAPRAQH